MIDAKHLVLLDGRTTPEYREYDSPMVAEVIEQDGTYTSGMHLVCEEWHGPVRPDPDEVDPEDLVEPCLEHYVFYTGTETYYVAEYQVADIIDIWDAFRDGQVRSELVELCENHERDE